MHQSSSNNTKNYKNNRTIDRAAILEEIELNKIEELRKNLTNNKNFQRKYSHMGKANITNASASNPANFNSSLVNHISVINENQKMQNISRVGGLGGLSGFSRQAPHQGGGFTGATTASQTTLNINTISQDKSSGDGRGDS